MKKIVLCILAMILIMFLLPIFLTRKFNVIDASSQNENLSINSDEIQSDYLYSNYATIKLLHSSSGEIEEMKLDDYLLGVVSAEMPADYEIEALKAQAIVARTYTIYTIKNGKNKHNGADICDNSSCCQAWNSKEDRFLKWNEDVRDSNWEKIEKAVNSTQGKVITYNGEEIEAFFHSNSGGKTEEVSSVWGGTDLPYLQSVETSGEDAYTQYSSEVEILKSDFETKLKEKHSDFEINWNDNNCIQIIDYTEGNRVKTIKIGNLNLSGVELRSIIGLKSANFKVELNSDTVKFTVIGYGHGVRYEPNRSRYSCKTR